MCHLSGRPAVATNVGVFVYQFPDIDFFRFAQRKVSSETFSNANEEKILGRICYTISTSYLQAI